MNEVLFEEVDLPSGGLLYATTSPLSTGKIKLKYPTTKEEDILTNINYIKNGTVFDKLIESLCVDKININDLLIGDKNAILIAVRILAYSQFYKIKVKDQIINVDLTQVKENTLDEKLPKEKGINEFSFELPYSKHSITFKLPTVADEIAIDKELEGLKKIKASDSPSISTRLKHLILSVNGKRDTKSVREFVDIMLSKDSKAFREYINKIAPNVDIVYAHDFGDGVEEGPVPITSEFFWPE